MSERLAAKSVNRRTLFRLAAGAAGFALVPDPVRRYFIIGQPERRILAPRTSVILEMSNALGHRFTAILPHAVYAGPLVELGSRVNLAAPGMGVCWPNAIVESVSYVYSSDDTADHLSLSRRLPSWR